MLRGPPQNHRRETDPSTAAAVTDPHQEPLRVEGHRGYSFAPPGGVDATLWPSWSPLVPTVAAAGRWRTSCSLGYPPRSRHRAGVPSSDPAMGGNGTSRTDPANKRPDREPLGESAAGAFVSMSLRSPCAGPRKAYTGRQTLLLEIPSKRATTPEGLPQTSGVVAGLDDGSPWLTHRQPRPPATRWCDQQPCRRPRAGVAPRAPASHEVCTSTMKIR